MKGNILVVLIFLYLPILASCESLQVQQEPSPSASTPRPLATRALPTTASTQPPTLAPHITSVDWVAVDHVINVGVKSWPQSWEPGQVFIDGVEIRLSEEPGGVVIRPNAPLEQPPDGFLIGTLPWVSGLDETVFPCCGTIQFSVPESGMTNSFDYNLSDAGCRTAATNTCLSEWSVQEGDWMIEGGETRTIENARIIQKGNIYIRDSATLVIKNSEIKIERGGVPTIHVYFFVDPQATLIIDNSRIYPGPESGALVCVFNHGTTKLMGSPTSIHYFDMSDGAILDMQDSEMIYEIGGLLQVTGGSTEVSNSTIGALGIRVPNGAHLDASGLQSGTFFEHWNIQDMIPEANYELTFDDVTLLKDDFTGEYEHGPYERGWIFFLDPDSHVRLSDSELRKVFLEVNNDSVEFRDLRIGEPSDLQYRDILLEDVVVEGEWPFTINDSNVTFINSNYLFLQPGGASTVELIDSHMVEFIPRNFYGSMKFTHGEWTNAGEILGNVDYHSMANHFTISGSLKISADVREHLQWKNAQVTRVFEVYLYDTNGAPINRGVIKIEGREYATDENGKTEFSFVFNDDNYNQPVLIEAWNSGNLVSKIVFDFFTETPILISP